jgi:hypothetical protein
MRPVLSAADHGQHMHSGSTCTPQHKQYERPGRLLTLPWFVCLQVLNEVLFSEGQ